MKVWEKKGVGGDGEVCEVFNFDSGGETERETDSCSVSSLFFFFPPVELFMNFQLNHGMMIRARGDFLW